MVHIVRAGYGSQEAGAGHRVLRMQAIDGDTGQVGPGIAVHINYAQVAYVAQIKELDVKKMLVRRLIEEVAPSAKSGCRRC